MHAKRSKSSKLSLFSYCADFCDCCYAVLVEHSIVSAHVLLNIG
jgi:hypothetical protein